MNGPLNNLLILDLTSRLPGPLAACFLRNQGAKILKLNTLVTHDPFKESSDRIFNFWNKQLNENSELFEAQDLTKKILEADGQSLELECPKCHCYYDLKEEPDHEESCDGIAFLLFEN